MPRYPHDYHLHSNLSVDCDVPMAAQCARAVELEIGELCVTEHSDWHPLDLGFGYYRPDAYFAELARCRERFDGRLTLLAGVELSEPHMHPEEARALLAAWPYDLAIGSLHFVGDLMSLDREFFDRRDARVAYESYFSDLATMVRAGGFDIVGHLDVPKRVGHALCGYDARDYEEPIRAVLRACVEHGIGIEINTSTYRRGVGEPCPPGCVLSWYRELGGEILTLGSDAHDPAALAAHFDEALELARAAGFRYLTHFRARVPRFEPLP